MMRIKERQGWQGYWKFRTLLLINQLTVKVNRV